MGLGGKVGSCGGNVRVWEFGPIALAVGRSWDGFERNDEGGAGGGRQQQGDLLGKHGWIDISRSVGDDAASVMRTVQDGDGVTYAGLGA